jgi:hypothetical protein
MAIPAARPAATTLEVIHPSGAGRVGQAGRAGTRIRSDRIVVSSRGAMVSRGPKRFAPEPNAEEVLFADFMGSSILSALN